MLTENQIEDALTLDDLSKLISACDRCTLGNSKTNDVFGIGDGNARILFIGEAPGKEEDLRGEPFVGSAGRLLNELMAEIGLKREDVFIANVLKHRPPTNRDPNPEEISACWPFLKKQIELIDPKLIVFLGRHALSRFFPSLQISQVHGKAFRKDFNGREKIFLPLYHPAAALYNGSLKEVLKSDFQVIPEILKKLSNNVLQNKLF